MRGRKPDRSNVHELAGNIAHRRRRSSTPARPLMDTKPPRRLRGMARATWVRVAPQLLEDQTLTELSVDLLVAYCDAVADYERDRLLVDALAPAETVVATANGGQQQHMAISNANRSLDRMVKLGEIFAIDPYTRERRGKGGPEPEKDAGSEIEQLMSKGA